MAALDTLTFALGAAGLAAVGDAGRFVICAGGVFLLAKRIATVSPARRIQARRWGNADLRREVGNAIRTVLLYAIVGSCLVIADRHGAFPSPTGLSWPEKLASFVGLVVWHDVTFYFLHRALHTRWLWRFHVEHHRSITPSAFAAYSFGGVEALLQVVFLPVWYIVVPMDRIVLAAFIFIAALRSAVGHAGVELLPAWWLDRWWSSIFATTVHHDLHHSGRRASNFGLYFVFWDRLMTTEHPNYIEHFRSIAANNRERVLNDLA